MEPRRALLLVLAALALASLIRAEDGESTAEPNRPYRSLRRGLQDNDAPDPLENEFEQQNAAPSQFGSDEDGDDRELSPEHRRKRIRHGFKGSRDPDEDSLSGGDGQDARGPPRDDDTPPARNIPGEYSRGDSISEDDDRDSRRVRGPSDFPETRDSNLNPQARPPNDLVDRSDPAMFEVKLTLHCSICVLKSAFMACLHHTHLPFPETY